ncbi:4'-phosphopantetheinyl transferase superfamily protein [Muricauda oceani]|uniref:4-phosphopantetheinyl transferase family protein n=1 Tax=Flagellimonas oceani TaxID=2698672 RepID=A0A6G7J5M3_9FLAO|nr:4'-phosphopantetheinyl transferase superfamily protein [Allomuricauda oceani]MBW8243514.1 4'-phosphopantetheinyl transferase superfamily protein [Allomuricauda oceani]QII45727.1 4-phosphopantetheinyl transferase family protein [Allomuricauda oceani]
MVGNDIVDLAEARYASNWQRPRFLDKLFSESEQTYIQNTANPFRMVWRLWSIKEASYKLYTQLHPVRFYNPKAFECETNHNSWVVGFKDFQCYIETTETANYILSEARLNRQNLGSNIIKFESTGQKQQSNELKERLLSCVADSYQLVKNEMGVPALTNGEQILSVSLTHHGSYGAFAIG